MSSLHAESIFNTQVTASCYTLFHGGLDRSIGSKHTTEVCYLLVLKHLKLELNKLNHKGLKSLYQKIGKPQFFKPAHLSRIGTNMFAKEQ
jgi:hypothetical protein